MRNSVDGANVGLVCFEADEQILNSFLVIDFVTTHKVLLPDTFSPAHLPC